MSEDEPPVISDAASAGTRRSPLAISSLVLGILGFCTAGLTGIIGLVLGIVALASGDVKGSGRGVAITGVVISIISLIVAPIVFLIALMLPAIAVARDTALNVKSMAMMQQVAVAAELYAADNDGVLPPADDWVVALDEYHGDVASMVAAPDDSSGLRAFAMNAALDRARLVEIDDPAATVLFFEITPGDPLAGGPELLPDRPRHRYGFLLVFIDGHAENVPQEDLGSVLWETEAADSR